MPALQLGLLRILYLWMLKLNRKYTMEASDLYGQCCTLRQLSLEENKNNFSSPVKKPKRFTAVKNQVASSGALFASCFLLVLCLAYSEDGGCTFLRNVEELPEQMALHHSG
jgi:hypothetical protein